MTATGTCAAILAGGLATRMQPITKTIPKSMIDVGGEPFIQHQLRLLGEHGIERVVLCVGHLGEQIREQLGDRFHGVDLSYVFDGPRLLGTAGALKRALSHLPSEFFVLYGDSYLRCDYQAAWRAYRDSGKRALMTVCRNEGGTDHSNVVFDGQEIRVYDKVNRTPAMHHIDYGLGIIAASAFAGVPHDQPFDLATLYQELLATGELAAFEMPERYYEIGSPRGLEELRAVLAGGHR